MMILYVFTTVLILLGLYLRHLYSRFSKCGVKNFPPLPLVGNFGEVVLRRKFFGDALLELYTQFPDEKFVGNYELLSPVIFIKDINLIKKIAIEHSESFMDHRVFISEESDPYFGRTLFMLRGQKWKDMRTMLSPAFTTIKLKQMIPLMADVGDRTVSFLRKNIEDSDTGFLDIDVKDLANRFANDVMASCALGLDVDSFADPDNELFRMGNEASHFSFKILMKFFGYYSVPYVMKKLNITFLSTDTRDFFKQLALRTMKEREESNIQRPDFIQLLIEGRKVWDDQDLIAQVILVVIAAYETISTTMSFLLYELAVNPDIQDRLVREIREHSRNKNGMCDYESIQTMTYLNMVISELLRLWPPAVASDRLCTKDYNLGRPNENATQDFIVRVGEDVLIPIMAIHRDPNFFPDPLKFDPERFSETNKPKIQPFTYIPFGLGPRSCIGYRFALHSVKIMVYLLLKHMVVVPCKRTTIPAKLCPESFTLKLKGGHWVRLKKRREQL